MNERTIQIDVIGKIEGTQFMKCKHCWALSPS